MSGAVRGRQGEGRVADRDMCCMCQCVAGCGGISRHAICISIWQFVFVFVLAEKHRKVAEARMRFDGFGN